jgi:CheY-like chemotaxis protein
VRVQFWGTRGSIAKPGPGTVRYGGNTSCIEVRSARETLVIVDCGTGGHSLGQKLMSGGAKGLRGHILISETLAGQMQYTYFPVTPDQFGATIHYHDLVEGTFSLVILEHDKARVDGMANCRAIRQIKDHETPVVMVAAQEDPRGWGRYWRLRLADQAVHE